MSAVPDRDNIRRTDAFSEAYFSVRRFMRAYTEGLSPYDVPPVTDQDAELLLTDIRNLPSPIADGLRRDLALKASQNLPPIAHG